MKIKTKYLIEQLEDRGIDFEYHCRSEYEYIETVVGGRDVFFHIEGNKYYTTYEDDVIVEINTISAIDQSLNEIFGE